MTTNSPLKCLICAERPCRCGVEVISLPIMSSHTIKAVEILVRLGNELKGNCREGF